MSLIATAFAATQAVGEESTGISAFLGKAVFAGIIFVASFVIATILRSWVQKMIRKKQGDRHQELVILYGRIAFTSVLVIGAIVGLTLVGAPLEYFSGGIGLGFAFALKDILINFFSGIILLSNDKFNLGDFIIVDPDSQGKSSTMGTIVDIKSRATSLRAIDGGEITVPNANMINAKVTCYTKNPIRRHEISIGVGYGANLKEASELILEIIKANKDVEPEPEPIVLAAEVGESAVTLSARFWIDSKAKWWIVKSELTQNIFNTLQEVGIDIPYPVRTLRVDKDSSDLLANQSHLLENLEKIKANKPSVTSNPNNVKKEVFRPAPNEAVTS